jgi:hypothetical protein
MKRLSMFFFATGFSFSSSFCVADEYLTSKSPDGKFASHVSRGDKQPFPQSCGELEGDDSVGLEFFEIGTDGKMQKAARKIFPIADQWSTTEDDEKYSDFRFDLSRRGRTVLVRSAKTKKVLYKVTWNGEKFVQQRDAAPK